MEKMSKSIDDIKNFSKSIRKIILDMALEAGSSSAHIGGALSISDIMSVLYCSILNLEKDDKFILSKGHACLAYYASLHLIGKISSDEIKSFEKDKSKLPGHPVKHPEIGIDFSNGSLGMGLSIGIGLAISSKKKNKNNRIFVMLGDGECNEGSVWEAAMSAPKFKLDNLIVIIDRNKFQQTGSSDQIMDLGNLKDKWMSFGWDVKETDGHDLEKLDNYFNNINENNLPKVLIANTIKGKGFSFSENNNDWHHSVLTKSIYDKAIKELK